MNIECANLLSFLSGELEDKEKKAFVEHLTQCSECTREYEQMTEAWKSLKWDFEEKEPSASLKSEVMNFVFEMDDEVQVRREKNWSRSFFKQFTPVTSGPSKRSTWSIYFYDVVDSLPPVWTHFR